MNKDNSFKWRAPKIIPKTFFKNYSGGTRPSQKYQK